MQRATFHRHERLKHSRIIDELFANGKSFAVYPLRIVYLELPEGASPVQAGFSVSKRRFSEAWQRNLLRRRMREAYRLQKYRLYESLDGQSRYFALMILYTAAEPLPYEQIAKAMYRLLRRFIRREIPTADQRAT